MKTKNYDLTEKQVKRIKEAIIQRKFTVDSNIQNDAYTENAKERMIDHINTCNDILKKLKD